jgi:hemoglobin
MEKHLPLLVDARHFDCWIELVEETARETRPTIAADHFVQRAQRVAESLELGIAGQTEVFLPHGRRNELERSA